MPKRSIGVAIFIIVLCLLAACSAAPLKTTIPAATARAERTAALPTPTEIQRATNTPTVVQTPTVQGTPTETITPTPLPIQWFVPAQQLPDIPDKTRQLSWLNAHTLRFKMWDESAKFLDYDLQSLPAGYQEQAFIAKTFHDFDPQVVKFSPDQTFAVVCTDKTDEMYHKLQLYQVQEDKLLSEVANVSLHCFSSFEFRWAPNETALSFVNMRTAGETYTFPLDIYVWKTDGSKPFVAGASALLDEPGTWSPDSTRLVVETYNPAAIFPESDWTFQIMYPDGRPAKHTKASTAPRGQSGLSWLTNEIVCESNTYSTVLSFTDCYVAETGEHLTDLTWSNCFSSDSIQTQSPLLSEDQRWRVLDKTEDSFFVSDPAEFMYALYDLKARQLYTLSQSKEIFIDFVGWQGSSTFYLIRRPMNDQIQAKPDEPFGLLALDPTTRKMTLVNPDIRYAWFSPGNDKLIGAVRQGNQLSVAIYALDGKALTTPIQMNMPNVITLMKYPKLQSIFEAPGRQYYSVFNGELVSWSWSHDGKKVLVEDYSGTLWIIELDQSAKKMAENLQQPSSYLSTTDPQGQANTSALLWSPDDNYIIVRSSDKAWVLSVSNAAK